MTTKIKSKRNHHNGHNATGPKTARGKIISSRNAQKHGLLSNELIVSADEKPVLEHLQRSLRDELKPDSSLLTVLVEDIVVCYWDLKMCIRRKNEYLEKKHSDSSATDTTALSVDELRGDWNTRNRLRLLQSLREDVGPTGWISPSWKDPLVAAFGQELCDILMEWHATEGAYALLTEMVIEKDKIYKFRDPPKEDDVAAAAKRQEKLEAPLRREAIMKFIALVEQLLVTQAAAEMSWRESQGADPVELFQRYETTARRSWHRAIREFVSVRKDLQLFRN